MGRFLRLARYRRAMQGRLIGFDGLRGIAALSVLLFHALTWATGAARGNGYLAVDFFFMLSGYVMARTYEARLGQELSTSAFVRARYRRFLPVMAMAGLIALPGFLLTNEMSLWPVALANLLLIPSLFAGRLYPLNGPAWSILLELFANMAHGLVLRRLSTRILVHVVLLSATLFAVVASRVGVDVGAQPASFLFGLPRVMCAYGMGVILWRWWRDRPTITVPPLAALVAMPLYFGIGTMIDADGWISGMVFILLICPLMLAGGLRWQRQSRWMTAAGALSFPLYAVHAPVCMTGLMLGVPVAGGVAASLVVAGLIAWVQARPCRPRPTTLSSAPAAAS
ncbi:acyltransferase family protein [Sphingobium yanoikuyae]|uniref:acyltransferase family protein n=1 Tax=Sphingobium yanoikuyae TaxID=13690 RepID=UPI0035C6B8EE